MESSPLPQNDSVTLLVERALLGDESAFKEFYHRHARYVASIVYAILGQGEDLPDMVQETFLQAYRSLGSLKEPEKARFWLATIAVRKVYRLLAKRKKQVDHPLPLENYGAADKEKEELLMRDQLYYHLHQLPPKLRVPWSLYRLEELPLQEVAALCEISLATAKRRVAKGSDMLKRRMGNE